MNDFLSRKADQVERRELTDEQLLRYSRQIMLPNIDVVGQEKILNSSVLIVGLGGLGSPVAMYMASAGVGRLILVDHDEVELSNLQRQIIHSIDTVGESKVLSAKTRIAQLNPDCDVITHQVKLTDDNVESLVQGVDVVIDCSDNFTSRFALNRACVQRKVPLVSGAAIRMEGQLTVFDARRAGSPCYRCLYDDSESEDLSCATNGVLAPVVGVVGSIQALEALKLIAGCGESVVGKLMIFDMASMDWRTMKLKKDAACPVCG
ncbi:molybdopterin-synthase adenylyltransferase MoeB [Gammaproteobacteria bacterium 42_54_T18]|nr:molybdopterin-synthase adenylyltransferase MoeB [Gammaproteobacteria bacterium 42_54_T18]